MSTTPSTPSTTPLKCDFCSSQESAWEFPCKDFLDETGMGRSVGSWCACNICKVLVDAGEWEMLTDRCAAMLWPSLPPDADRVALRSMLGRLHQKFQQHRIGGVRPIPKVPIGVGGIL